MIRDLIEIAIDMVREEKLEDVADKAEMNAEERLLDSAAAVAADAGHSTEGHTQTDDWIRSITSLARRRASSRTREKLRQQLREGKLDERMVELDVREKIDARV